MSKDLAKLRQHLSRVKPWVFVAVALSLVLVAYYGFQGMRYWEARELADALNRDIKRLTAALSVGAPDDESLTQTTLARQQQLERLYGLFWLNASDELLGLIAQTAQETGVGINNISMGDQTLEQHGEVVYQVQPASLSLQGKTDNVLGFIADLQNQLPVVIASNGRMASLDTTPTVQLSLYIYLSPRDLAETEVTGYCS